MAAAMVCFVKPFIFLLCGIFHPKQKRTLQPCKEKYSTAHFAQSGSSSYTSPLWSLIHGLDVRLYLYWRSMFIILIGHQLATRPRNPVQSHFYFSTRAVLHLSIRRCISAPGDPSTPIPYNLAYSTAVLHLSISLKDCVILIWRPGNDNTPGLCCYLALLQQLF